MSSPERPRDGGRRSGSRGHVTVETLDPSQYERWSLLVRESPSGSVYSLPGYLETLCAAAGGRFFVLVALRGADIVGGIAVYERPSPLGLFVAPRLLLYYNGFVLREYQTRYPSERATRHAETLGALADELVRRGYGRLEVHSRSPVADARPLLDRGWRVTPSYTYSVPLTDLDDQWGRVEQNLRRLIGRARAEGLTLAVDEDFDSLYRLHSQTAARKGAPLYLGEDAFRRYYDELRAKGLCRLFHARLTDGRTGASQLVLTGHPVTHTVCAAADSELQSTGANAFLRWSAFEDLAAHGFLANDLTDATFAPVARFKAQLGGTLESFLVATRPPSPGFRLQTAVYRALRRARRSHGDGGN